MIYETYSEVATDQQIIKVKAEGYLSVDTDKNKYVTFKEGFRVALRSYNGLYMTINSFQMATSPVSASLKAECVWFDSENRLCRELFNLTSLVLHPNDVIEDK